MARVKLKVTVTYETEVEPSDFLDEGEDEDLSPGEVRDAYVEAMDEGVISLHDEVAENGGNIVVQLVS